jgi:hypothetical protein
MARSSEPPSPLVLAAQELEEELRRCEKAVADAVRLRLNSEKHIDKAARSLRTASEHRDALGGKVNALVAAVQAARVRADEAAAQMEKRAGEIQARLERLKSLQERAVGIAGSVRDATESAKQAKNPREILESLGPVEERLAKAHEEARAEDFEDVAANVAALREMVASMRRKLESL